MSPRTSSPKPQNENPKTVYQFGFGAYFIKSEILDPKFRGMERGQRKRQRGIKADRRGKKTARNGTK